MVAFEEGVERLDCPLYVLDIPGGHGCAVGGRMTIDADPVPGGIPVVGIAPPCLPTTIGDTSFCADHGLSYPCYSGSMAHGIASPALVRAMGMSGMLGFFGAAGLSLDALADAIRQLSQQMNGLPWGVNLINSPNDSAWECGVVSLFLEHEVRLIEASAYIFPTPQLVKYRVTGLHEDRSGNVIAPNRVIAKVSRVEVARRFMEPPPRKVLDKLLASGDIRDEEARLAGRVPLAQDITAEADSGGHTDHRAALSMLPSMLRLRDAIQKEHGYSGRLRVGLAGGIGAPEAVAAAFAMGAAYIVLGSVAQACVESGTSPAARVLLANAGQADIADAPAADMFEMGVTVQVLKRGTRFAERANRLYALYRTHDSIEDIPAGMRQKLEETIFQAPLEKVWAQTRDFFEQRNPRQLEKAEKNPKHKMALVFRWYLGNAAHWANHGIEGRQDDYQIWCGPAMGAFNDWVRGSFLESPEARNAPTVALNLLFGAAILLRIQCLRAQGLDIHPDSTWTQARKQFPPFLSPLPKKEP